jgi:hypothetical protein
MSIHAELLYLAEEIAEEMGNDHVWVDQLRNLAEEMVDDDKRTDGWSIGDLPLNEKNMMDVIEQMAGQLNVNGSIPSGNVYGPGYQLSNLPCKLIDLEDDGEDNESND